MSALGGWAVVWNLVKSFVLNWQRSTRAYEVGEEHYDRGNDLFRHMLDDRMVYSCGYWRRADTLEAQEAKLDLIYRKPQMEPGMRVLDVGCGWGGLAEYAVGEYGAEVVGVTISEEQVPIARDRCANLSVEIRLQDYRDVVEMFDRIVSIGMFEHVGHKNHRTYMETVHRCLKPEGLSMLHTIGRNTSSSVSDPWIDKYIFPNGLLPSTLRLQRPLRGCLSSRTGTISVSITTKR